MPVYFCDKVPHPLLNVTKARVGEPSRLDGVPAQTPGHQPTCGLPCRQTCPVFFKDSDQVITASGPRPEYLVLRSLEETRFLEPSQTTQSENVCENSLH